MLYFIDEFEFEARWWKIGTLIIVLLMTPFKY